MSDKLRIKLGPIEVEYEGNGVSRQDLLELAAQAARLYAQHGLQPMRDDADGDSSTPKRLQILGTTASIASRLNCVSGPELIIAAAARLTFVDGEEWFEPGLLLERMKEAAAHYDGSYRDALRDDIRVLTNSGKLVEVAPNLYALSATMRRELQQALAE